MSMSKKRQQGDAGIVDQAIIGPFTVDEGVKLNSVNFCNFLDKTLFRLYKFQSHSFRVKCVFMHEKAPSRVSKQTSEIFDDKGFT